jgi:hypothetical protein
MLFADLMGEAVPFLMLLFAFAMISGKYFLSKLDSKGEIKEAAKRKAVSTVLKWFQ